MAAAPATDPGICRDVEHQPGGVAAEALQQRGEQIAKDLGGLVMLGAGQFCTSPGLVLGIASPAFSAFVDALGSFFSAQPAYTLLNAGGLKSLRQRP
jgi:NADP-dependent aldehyde dehydrogenase